MPVFFVGHVGVRRDVYLWQFMICRNPSDFPDTYTVRPIVVAQPTSPLGEGVFHYAYACVCSTIAEARASVPRWADAKFLRDANDDPVIVETWL